MDHPFSFILHGHGLYTFFYMPCEHVAYLLWAWIFSIFDMPFGHVAYLLWVRIFSFFIAHTIYNMERVIMGQTRNFLLHGWIMLILSVGILHMKWMCTWSWSQSMKILLLGSHNLTKLNKVTSSIWIKFCKHYSYGSGRYLSSLMNLPLIFYCVLPN